MATGRSFELRQQSVVTAIRRPVSRCSVPLFPHRTDQLYLWAQNTPKHMSQLLP